MYLAQALLVSWRVNCPLERPDHSLLIMSTVLYTSTQSQHICQENDKADGCFFLFSFFCLNSQSFLVLSKVSNILFRFYVQLIVYIRKHPSRVIGKGTHSNDMMRSLPHFPMILDGADHQGFLFQNLIKIDPSGVAAAEFVHGDSVADIWEL